MLRGNSAFTLWLLVYHTLPPALQMPLDFVPREQEVTELALSMQDISTNLAVLIGAPGTGRTLLAASLSKELVETGYWKEAYWVDLQGVANHKLAGKD